MKTLLRRLGQVLFLGVLAALVWLVFTHKTVPPKTGAAAGGKAAQGGRKSGGPPPNVLVAKLGTVDVPVYVDAVGTVNALNSVAVSPQIAGTLTSLDFKEGQDVAKGALLATLDPATYQAALEQAQAKLAQDQALLANGQRDLKRYQGLLAAKAVTTQQADTQRATVAQQAAQVKSDQAAIDSARTTLAYTRITSPLAGRTGIRTLSVGAQVYSGGTATSIVTVTQMKPIGVVFNVPQQELGAINKAMASGPVTVEIDQPQTGKKLEQGVLKVINNAVDVTTGTVQMKAEVPNAGLALWPGAFVNVRVLETVLKGVIGVPPQALQRGPDGDFVYLLQGDKVSVRKVVAGVETQNLIVVTSGLKAGDVVVTSGFTQLADGSKVKVGTGAAGKPPS
ncbi:MAG: efflux RND transporter periplasmic adaptor subunit [Hyphomicrobiales bacterium]|nr:efflux RND transporter periplasmic adaptor subunit [Hyphomicrobiales bacterium]